MPRFRQTYDVTSSTSLLLMQILIPVSVFLVLLTCLVRWCRSRYIITCVPCQVSASACITNCCSGASLTSYLPHVVTIAPAAQAKESELCSSLCAMHRSHCEACPFSGFVLAQIQRRLWCDSGVKARQQQVVLEDHTTVIIIVSSPSI